MIHYFGPYGMRIVDWSEREYDEILVQNVRAKSDQFIIHLVIEFQPTLRRLKRVRKLLEKVSFERNINLIIERFQTNTKLDSPYNF